MFETSENSDARIEQALYFIVIFLANLSNVLMYIKAPALLKATNTVLVNVYVPLMRSPHSYPTPLPVAYDWTFHVRLSATLMSRLMINLRAVDEHKFRRTWDDSIPLRVLETRSCHDASSSSEVLPLV
ncbi:uncharacterized protein STEHIDRAFT_156705 [Stereum hirsutum FP-91666 SS1]|uniref:uncharacterized protein n=1 Tax=Stereum hirsutum (strain FP-91666) TaxID=721885 RepID=UPI000440BBA2|nr:uncharacterized protein STEHIDRAFT_156705 [Stereum hirsutum FP-91666 SS1]EIM86382.1 hypothetical protein STEHIDRAFT_156705 [Stereum hirsutum FP-91666 SS1]